MLLTSALALVDGELRPDFALRIEGGGIVAAGPRAQIVHPNDAITDLGRKLMLPGGVNAHCHSFQSLLRGIGDDLPFLQWRERALYRFTPHILAHGRSGDLRARGTYIGALFAFAEMALHGVSTVCDFFYLNEGGNEHARAVIQAARDIGLRIVLARCFYDWEGAPAAFRETPKEATRRFAELHRAFRGDPMVHIAAAPHSLHGASAPMIRAAVEAAREAGVRWHMHIAEEKHQVEDSLRRYGRTPLRALDEIVPIGDDLVVVHGCWLDEGERALLQERGAALCYCPGSNMFLGDGVTDIVDLVRRGVRLALGTDGGCANSRVSVLDEMRSCALLQKVSRCDGQAITAETCFAMGTCGGGQVLGLPVGRLRVGERADVCFADLDDPSLWPEHSLHKSVVYALSARAITDLYVDGQPVVRNRTLCRLPLEEVGRRVRELTQGWRDIL
ncbi:MAG: amidohydrolase family protein [Myxococcales bacterium]|nr:amidohydrolase family protein [Myxococcota bacterium]MDW8280493.1 amidohydrolase family protein [Myxococcales bacterium]